MHMMDWNAYRQQVLAGVGDLEAEPGDREGLCRAVRRRPENRSPRRQDP